MSLDDDPCIQVFKRRIGESFTVYHVAIEDFWNEVLSKHFKSFSEAVAFQENAVDKKDKFFILDLAQEYVEQHREWRYSTKTSKLSHIKSPFMHNRASLPQDRTFHFSCEVPPVEGKLTFDDFGKIVHSSSKLYRPVFLMMFESMMGEKELVYASNNYCEEILKHLTRNDGIFRLTIPGRKKRRNRTNYFTMLNTKGPWADAMRGYLKSLPEMPKDVLFRNSRGNPLTEYNIQFFFHCRAVETGVIRLNTPACTRCNGETVRLRKTRQIGEESLRKIVYVCKECKRENWASECTRARNNRYGVNPHEIRDLASSRWGQSGADRAVREYIMGHNITKMDPNKYEKIRYQPGFAESEYRKASLWLDIDADPQKVDRTEVDSRFKASTAEVEVLKREIVKLRRQQSDFQAILDKRAMLLRLAEREEKRLMKQKE